MEKYEINGKSDIRLHKAKKAILMQFNCFHIVIDVKGFFQINRQFVAAVRMPFMINHPTILLDVN